MKRSVGVLPRFAGFLAVAVGLILFITGIYMYSSGSLASTEGGIGAVVTLVVYPVVCAALGIAVVLTLLRLAMSSAPPLPSLLFIFVSVLIVIGFVLPVLREATGWRDDAGSAESAAPAFPTGTVLRAGRLAIVAEGQTGLRLEDVVTVDFTGLPRMHRYDRLFYDPPAGRFIAGDGSVYSAGGALFPDQRSVEIPTPVSEIVDDVVRFSYRLDELGVPWRSMTVAGYLELVVLSLLFTALWTVARISQWFLLNVALTFLSLRASLWIYSPKLLEFVRGQLPAAATAYTVVVSVSLLAVILVVVAILLPPLSRVGFDYEG